MMTCVHGSVIRRVTREAAAGVFPGRSAKSITRQQMALMTILDRPLILFDRTWRDIYTHVCISCLSYNFFFFFCLRSPPLYLACSICSLLYFLTSFLSLLTLRLLLCPSLERFLPASQSCSISSPLNLELKSCNHVFHWSFRRLYVSQSSTTIPSLYLRSLSPGPSFLSRRWTVSMSFLKWGDRVCDAWATVGLSYVVGISNI